VAQFDAPSGQPTYTEIYDKTVGALSAHFDSVDATLPVMADIVSALDAEQVADAASGTFDAATAAASGFDTASMDANVTAYEATAPISQEHIDAIGNSYPDILRELPMSATFDGAIGAPPTQTTIDLDPMSLNSAPHLIPLGTTTLTVQQQIYSGLQSAYFADGDMQFFEITEDYWQNGQDTIEKTFFSLVCKPLKVGKFFVELDVIQDFAPQHTILTVNMTVTP
jgi:hypothetical protein